MEGPRAGLHDAERLRDGRGHQGGVGQCGQRDPDHPIGEVCLELRRHRHREAGLAHPAWAGQGQQADVRPAEELGDGSDLLRAPDQGRRRQGQTGTVDRSSTGTGGSMPGLCRDDQGATILGSQGQRVRQAPHGRRVGMAQVLFEVAQPPHTQLSPCGQLFLGDPDGRTVAPEQRAE